MLLSLCLLNITLAYDFSGGYTSSKTVGLTGGDILTIGFSGSSALDIGMEGEEIPVAAVATGGTIARAMLNTILPVVIASAVIIFAVRAGSWIALLLGVTVGLLAYTIIQAILNAISQ